MVELGTSTSQGVHEPFFGDRGGSFRIRREARTPQLGGLYFFVIPLISTVMTIIMTSVLWEEGVPLALIGALFINIYFANKYLVRNTEPAMMFELTESRACILCPGLSEDPVVTVPFNKDTVVDVVLNESTTSDEYGHLCGWSFEDDDYAIVVSVHEDWDLWDIQAMREPVYKIIEHHGLEKGDTLRYYQEGMKGVVPMRRRSSHVT
jgi:hypothetical protein